jgi:hypothetical protein
VNHIHLNLSMALAALLLPLAALPGWSQAAHAPPAPEFGKVEFENDAIVVVRMHMAPHETTPMHDIPTPRLVIWLAPARLKDTAPDGTTSLYERPAGSVDWIAPRRHMGENLADQALDFLAVIPKAASAPPPHGR